MALGSEVKRLTRAIDVFVMFFPAEVINRTCADTNKYAWTQIVHKQSYAEPDGSWKEVMAADLMFTDLKGRRPHIRTPPQTKNILHKLFRLEKRRRRKKCCNEDKVDRRTNVICKTCNVCLRFTTARNCFAQWHINLGN